MSFDNLPDEWDVVKLGEVAEIYDKERIPLSEMERSKRKGIYPYCGANGIIDHIDDYIFNGEFVLLAEDGGAFDAFENTAYIMSGKFWVNNHAHILKAIEEKTSNLFLLFTLNFLDLNTYIVGSTRKKLNQSQMRKIKIPLPPLPEQHRIIKILSTIDNTIQKVDNTIAKTEQLKKGLMRELLTKGIGHEKFKDTKIGGIPEEWEYTAIGQYIDLLTGYPFKSNEFSGDSSKMRLLRGINITEGRLRWSADSTKYWGKFTDELETYLLKEGDLVIGMDGSKVGKNYAIVSSNNLPALLVQRVARIRVKKGLDIKYLYYLVGSWLFRRHVDAVKTSSGIPHISAIQIKDFYTPLPPLPEQKRIAEILSTVDKKLKFERKRREKLMRVKKGLMNDLLTGRKRAKIGV